MSAILLDKIAAVRRKEAAVSVGHGIGLVVGAAVVLLAAEMIIDWWLNLRPGLRAAALVFDLLAISFLVVWFIAIPTVMGPDDEEIALRVEHELPGFATRLIASVQLSRPGAVPAGASMSLVQAMIVQTEQYAEPVPFTQVVKPNRMFWAVGVASIIALTGLAAFNWFGQDARDLLDRAFLGNTPVPRKTHIEVVTKDVKIARGDQVTLEVRANGIRPDKGELHMIYPNGKAEPKTIERVKNEAGLYRLTIENVQKTFQYVVYLNDGESEPYTVKVVDRPGIVQMKCEQTFPAYTGLPPRIRSTGDLRLLAGSTLKVTATANKPVENSELRERGANASPKLTIDRSDAQTQKTMWTEPPLKIEKGLTGISVHINQDEDNLQSLSDVVYPVSVIADDVPKLAIKVPERKTEKVTTQGRVLISFEASDDWGIAKIRLWHRMKGDKDAVSQELDLEGKTPKSMVRRYEWDLKKLDLKEGQEVEFWLEAEDNNNVTGPGKATGGDPKAPYTLKVVSNAEKLEDLFGRVDELWGTIDDTKRTQEELNAKLGEIIHEK